jgi:hypothetical protein
MQKDKTSRAQISIKSSARSLGLRNNIIFMEPQRDNGVPLINHSGKETTNKCEQLAATLKKTRNTDKQAKNYCKINRFLRNVSGSLNPKLLHP